MDYYISNRFANMMNYASELRYNKRLLDMFVENHIRETNNHMNDMNVISMKFNKFLTETKSTDEYRKLLLDHKREVLECKLMHIMKYILIDMKEETLKQCFERICKEYPDILQWLSILSDEKPYHKFHDVAVNVAVKNKNMFYVKNGDWKSHTDISRKISECTVYLKDCNIIISEWYIIKEKIHFCHDDKKMFL